MATVGRGTNKDTGDPNLATTKDDTELHSSTFVTSSIDCDFMCTSFKFFEIIIIDSCKTEES